MERQKHLAPAPCLLVGGLLLLALMARGQTVRNVGYGYYNCWLIAHQGKYLLIDTGLPGKERRIERRLHRAGVRPEQISAIVLTHGHSDHAGGARYFQTRYRIPVLVGKGDSVRVTRGTNGTLTLDGHNPGLNRLVRRVAVEAFPPLKSFTVVHDTLPLAPFGFPGRLTVSGGHTEGSVVVRLGGMLFTGDLVRGALLPGFQRKPRIHFFAEDAPRVYQQLIDLSREPSLVLYPGHGGPFTTRQLSRLVAKKRLPGENASHIQPLSCSPFQSSCWR